MDRPEKHMIGFAQTEQGRGILGVIDGAAPKGIETPDDQDARHSFLRKIGYKR